MPTPSMVPSESLFNLLKTFEGLRLVPYNDTANNATVGIGHLLHKGPVTSSDQSINEDQAIAFLNQDAQVAVNAVNKFVIVNLTQNEFDALVSWTYNLGAGTLQNSKVLELLNQGKYVEASDHMLLYVNSGGKYTPGLATRRRAEVSLFLNQE